ncbi:Glycosyltransferase, GT2 family [Micromonospora haikouensis]|uniref:Glycosyltransferase, GT2 family n=1 Tax=Micromonospora haikouensis TaxID=686309 RepID=A0A1C4XDP3_9ACTN|nr:glycosyltransferase [Micromonospora haikouensis]SCF06424.1 Glycosyltransferase, GT2 family [Micromonospora haikouensis]
MRTLPEAPDLSVVIPTYNRSHHLRTTLEHLARQHMSPDRFEVVVVDDGSTDDSFDVCHAFQSVLPLRYAYQPDLGFRASAARNRGARSATAPILVFLDTGSLPGPGFLDAHLAAHADGPAGGHAVAGYAYGYRPYDPTPDLAELLVTEGGAAGVVDRYGHDPRFFDWRHEHLAALDFDPDRHPLPWIFYWSMNCSVRRTDFFRVGGFTESFPGWGSEDMEIGLRLIRHGIKIKFSRSAWVVEAPHDRDVEGNLASLFVNLDHFLDLHRDPLGELTWATFRQNELWPVADAYRELTEWRQAARGLDVSGEIADAIRAAGPVRPGRVAVVGAGQRLPADLPDAELIEFDETIQPDLERGRHRFHHAIGLRTALPSASMDTVVLTARLHGLWDRWGRHLLDEAHRIAATVQVSPALRALPGAPRRQPVA